VDAALQAQIPWYERVIAKIHNRLYTIPKNLPQLYLDGLSTVKPPPTTTTFPPQNRNTHWINSFLRIKLDKMKKLFKDIEEEDDKYARGENLPGYYIQLRQERFFQLFSLANDIVGTFMGAFNAYEI
jgi:hypothetical protein